MESWKPGSWGSWRVVVERPRILGCDPDGKLRLARQVGRRNRVIMRLGIRGGETGNKELIF